MELRHTPGYGWYWFRYRGRATSQYFATEDEARHARNEGGLRWGKDE